jgi:hypothetical protein
MRAFTLAPLARRSLMKSRPRGDPPSSTRRTCRSPTRALRIGSGSVTDSLQCFTYGNFVHCVHCGSSSNAGAIYVMHGSEASSRGQDLVFPFCSSSWRYEFRSSPRNLVRAAGRGIGYHDYPQGPARPFSPGRGNLRRSSLRTRQAPLYLHRPLISPIGMWDTSTSKRDSRLRSGRS